MATGAELGRSYRVGTFAISNAGRSYGVWKLAIKMMLGGGGRGKREREQDGGGAGVAEVAVATPRIDEKMGV